MIGARYVVLTTLAGCTVFAASTGGPSENGGAPNDAGVDADARGVVDGAAVEDASPSDAGSDAGWCARLVPPPTFCDDFDRDTPARYGWAPVNDPMRLQDETRTFVSAPRSFLSVLREESGPMAYASMEQTFPGHWREVHLDFAIRTGDLDGGLRPAGAGVASWFTKTDGGSPSDCRYILTSTPNDAWVQVQAPNVDPLGSFHLARYPLPGKWSTLKVFLDGTLDRQMTLSIQIDDAPALPDTLLTKCSPGDAFTFAPGLFDEQGSLEVRFDNIRIDLK